MKSLKLCCGNAIQRNVILKAIEVKLGLTAQRTKRLAQNALLWNCPCLQGLTPRRTENMKIKDISLSATASNIWQTCTPPHKGQFVNHKKIKKSSSNRAWKATNQALDHRRASRWPLKHNRTRCTRTELHKTAACWTTQTILSPITTHQNTLRLDQRSDLSGAVSWNCFVSPSIPHLSPSTPFLLLLQNSANTGKVILC